MLRYLIAVLFVASLTTVADAARFPFVGWFYITGKAGACNDYDPVGTRGIATLLYETGGNRRNAIVLFQDEFAKGYRRQNFFVGKWKPVDTMYMGYFGWGSDDSVSHVFLRILSQTLVPAGSNFTNAKFINMVFQVYNFDFMPGCLVTISLTTQKRLS